MFAVVTAIYQDGTSTVHRVHSHPEMLNLLDSIFMATIPQARGTRPLSINIAMLDKE